MVGYIPKIILAAVISISEVVFKKVAYWLNRKENYRLQSMHENQLILKLVTVSSTFTWSMWCQKVLSSWQRVKIALVLPILWHLAMSAMVLVMWTGLSLIFHLVNVNDKFKVIMSLIFMSSSPVFVTSVWCSFVMGPSSEHLIMQCFWPFGNMIFFHEVVIHYPIIYAIVKYTPGNKICLQMLIIISHLIVSLFSHLLTYAGAIYQPFPSVILHCLCVERHGKAKKGKHIIGIVEKGINTYIYRQFMSLSTFFHSCNNTALLWQKEASDIPSKSELWMCSYFTYCALLPGQVLCINTH